MPRVSSKAPVSSRGNATSTQPGAPQGHSTCSRQPLPLSPVTDLPVKNSCTGKRQRQPTITKHQSPTGTKKEGETEGVTCPICQATVLPRVINKHLDLCLSGPPRKASLRDRSRGNSGKCQVSAADNDDGEDRSSSVAPSKECVASSRASESEIVWENGYEMR